MSATGMGLLTIDVPDGADITHSKLTVVLGFELTFSGGKCIVHRPEGDRVCVAAVWALRTSVETGGGRGVAHPSSVVVRPM